MITVVLLMMELMRLSDGIQLRSAKNCLKAKTDENNGDEFCQDTSSYANVLGRGEIQKSLSRMRWTSCIA